MGGPDALGAREFRADFDAAEREGELTARFDEAGSEFAAAQRALAAAKHEAAVLDVDLVRRVVLTLVVLHERRVFDRPLRLVHRGPVELVAPEQAPAARFGGGCGERGENQNHDKADSVH